MQSVEVHKEPLSWLPTTTCILWGLLCIILYFSGLLVLVQRSLFSYFTLGAGFCLLGLGAAKYLVGDEPEDSTHHHHPVGGLLSNRALRVTVLLVPILGGLLLQGDGLGALAARKRGVFMDAGAIRSLLTAKKELRTKLKQEYRYAEVTGIYLMGDDVVGQKVATMGFVFKGKQIPEGHFAVVRFYIWCCAADARAISVLVKYDKTDKLTENHWVKVYGVLRNYQMGKKKVPMIEADRIELCGAPGRPYLE